MKDFKAFLLRGNLVELAVAFVIGTAFAAVITALVRDILTPIISAVVGKPSFFELTFTIHHAVFAYGDFLNNVITFVLIAAAVFYFVVKPMNALMARRQHAEPTTRACPHCLSEIPVAATVCASCTRDVQPAGG